MQTIRIETERLILRSPQPEDAKALGAIFTDPDATTYLGVKNQPFVLESPEKLKARVEKRMQFERDHGFTIFSVDLKETGETIGDCGLAPVTSDDGDKSTEVGYHFAKAHWGKGYATEAAIAALLAGFTRFELPHIIAVCDQGNGASERVMQKAGMHYVGIRPYFGEQLKLYEAMRDAWLKSR